MMTFGEKLHEYLEQLDANGEPYNVTVESPGWPMKKRDVIDHGRFFLVLEEVNKWPEVSERRFVNLAVVRSVTVHLG